MRLKTYTAPTTQAAMSQIRQEIGEDAVIVSTTRDKRGGAVTMTVAIDQPAVTEFPFPVKEISRAAATAAQAPPPASTEASPMMQQLEALLQYHSVPAKYQRELMGTADLIDFPRNGDAKDLENLLAKLLHSSFRFLPLPLSRSGFRCMLVGQPGIGKTMTLAKMAAQLTLDKIPVHLVTFDTQGAGGVDRLRAFTDILDVPLSIAETPEELADIAHNINDQSTVLIDSFGCNPYNATECEELAGFIRATDAEAILTLAAGGDAQEAADIASAFQFTSARRMMVTCCDLTRRYGSLLSAASAANLAFCNYSASARVVGEYGPLGNKKLAGMMNQRF